MSIFVYYSNQINCANPVFVCWVRKDSSGEQFLTEGTHTFLQKKIPESHSDLELVYQGEFISYGINEKFLSNISEAKTSRGDVQYKVTTAGCSTEMQSELRTAYIWTDNEGKQWRSIISGKEDEERERLLLVIIWAIAIGHESRGKGSASYDEILQTLQGPAKALQQLKIGRTELTESERQLRISLTTRTVEQYELIQQSLDKLLSILLKQKLITACS